MDSIPTAALVGGTVVDGRGGPPRSDATVLLTGDTILDVVPGRPDLGDAVQVIDVSGKTVMPGVIDAHVHLAGWAQWLIAQQHERLLYLAARTAHAMRASLECGITAMRDLGGLEAGFVKAQRDGLLPGPRLQTAVVIIQSMNGVTDNIPGQGGTTSPQGLSTTIPGMPLPYVNGPWEARQKVREVLRAGADVIKIATTGFSIAGVPQRELPALSYEEIKAVVDEAHDSGVMVTCHAAGGEGLRRAVKAGVDTIEHGNTLDDEIAAEMADRGTWLVPMLWILNFHATTAPTEERRERYRRAKVVARDALQTAMKHGIRIAMGSDSGEHGIGGSMKEIDLMVEAGMSPSDALRASTQRAAECLQWGDTLGTIEPGKQTDLLVIDGDPLRDVRILQQRDCVAMVLQAGRPV